MRNYLWGVPNSNSPPSRMISQGDGGVNFLLSCFPSGVYSSQKAKKMAHGLAFRSMVKPNIVTQVVTNIILKNVKSIELIESTTDDLIQGYCVTFTEGKSADIVGLFKSYNASNDTYHFYRIQESNKMTQEEKMY